MEEPVTKIIKKKYNYRPKTSKSLHNKRNIQHLEINDKNRILETINENLLSKNDIIEEIELHNNQMKNLMNINLIEKDINTLYKWEHLFNNFRPINCYTTINSNKNEMENKEENKNEEFKSPILLVDLPENQMNLFFRKSNYETSRNKKINYEKLQKNGGKGHFNSYNDSKINNNVNHNIRPMSMYSPRIDNSCYYFSSVFSDYYKEDFKSFCNKMPILKAKLKINPEKLKREIDKHDKLIIKKEKIINNLRSQDNILLEKQNLVIAAKRKNPIPLLKSIFKQNYPEFEIIKDKPKLYFNTMKPYGNNYGNVDYQQNDRWKLSNEIIKMRNKNKNEDYKNQIINSNYNHKGKKGKKQLLLSYYDENDPYIAIFNTKINNLKTQNIKNRKIEYYNVNRKNNENNEKINIINDNNINNCIDNKEIENTEAISDRQQNNLKSKINYSNRKDNQEKKNNNNNIKTSINKNGTSYSTTLNNLGAKDDSLYNDYLSSNRFPLKTSSDVGNTSYNKINQFIREKKLLNKLKIDYSLTRSNNVGKSQTKDDFAKSNTNNTTNRIDNIKRELNLILESKKIKPKKSFSLYKAVTTNDKNNNSGIKKYQHWDKQGNLINNNSQKVNYFCFNNYIETTFNKDLIVFKKNEDNQYFYPMNTYNKLAGKYYHLNDESKNKNNKSKNDIHNLFDYSRDDPDNDTATTRKLEQKIDNNEI